jgi:hypothetical protein
LECLCWSTWRCWLQVIEMGRYEMDTWYYSPYPGGGMPGCGNREEAASKPVMYSSVPAVCTEAQLVDMDRIETLAEACPLQSILYGVLPLVSPTQLLCAPRPTEPYASQNKLYICEFTLKYFRKKSTLIRHLAKLEIRHPPGNWQSERNTGRKVVG